VQFWIRPVANVSQSLLFSRDAPAAFGVELDDNSK
jgi:hypothetical protein